MAKKGVPLHKTYLGMVLSLIYVFIAVFIIYVCTKDSWMELGGNHMKSTSRNSERNLKKKQNFGRKLEKNATV